MSMVLLLSLCLAAAPELEVEVDAGVIDSPADTGDDDFEQSKDPLVNAAKAGDVATLKKLLKDGASPDTLGAYGIPVLEVAIENHRADAARVLIEAGAALKGAKGADNSMISAAIQAELPEIALLLIKKGASLEGPKGFPTLAPLAQAASNKYLDVVKALLAKKAPVDAEILESATQGGDLVIVKLLATQLKDKQQLAEALEAAIEQKSLPLVKELLAAGAPPDAPTTADSQSPLGRAIFHGDLPLAMVLLEHGADPNRQSFGTPLLNAVSKGDEPLLKLMLKKGASPNAWHARMGSALGRAIFEKKDWAVAALLEAGADPNLCSYDGDSAMHWATHTKVPGLVQLLLKKGANPNAGGGHLTALVMAVLDDQPTLIKALLDAGADPNQLGESLSPLRCAAESNRLEAARLLLAAGARVDLSGPPKGTALDWAKSRKLTAMVDLLTTATVTEAATPRRLPLEDLGLVWTPGDAVLSAWSPAHTLALGRLRQTGFSRVGGGDGSPTVFARAVTTIATCAQLMDATSRALSGCALSKGKSAAGLDPSMVRCKVKASAGVPAWESRHHCAQLPGVALLLSVSHPAGLPAAEEQQVQALLTSLVSAGRAMAPPMVSPPERLAESGLFWPLPRGAEEWLALTDSDLSGSFDVVVRVTPNKPSVVVKVHEWTSWSCDKRRPVAADQKARPTWLPMAWKVRELQPGAKGAFALGACGDRGTSAVELELHASGALARADEEALKRLFGALAGTVGLGRKLIEPAADGTFALPNSGLTLTPAAPRKDLEVTSGKAAIFADRDLSNLWFDVIRFKTPSTFELGLAVYRKDRKKEPLSCDKVLKDVFNRSRPERFLVQPPGWNATKVTARTDEGEFVRLACREGVSGPVLAIATGTPSDGDSREFELMLAMISGPAPAPIAAAPAAGPRMARIVNAGARFETLSTGNCVQWPSPEAKKAGNPKSWTATPRNGDVGEVLGTAKHCQSYQGTVVFLKLKTGVVPLMERGVQYLPSTGAPAAPTAQVAPAAPPTPAAPPIAVPAKGPEGQLVATPFEGGVRWTTPEARKSENFGEALIVLGDNLLITRTATMDAASQGLNGSVSAVDPTGKILSTLKSPLALHKSGTYFGSRATLSDGKVLISASGAPEGGALVVLDAASGALLKTYAPPSGAGRFGGSAVAVAGIYFVGAFTTVVNGQSDSGAVYAINAETGAVVRQYVAPSPRQSANFGYSVLAVGSQLVVGAVGDSAMGQYSGAVVVFDQESGAVVKTLHAPQPAPSGSFGQGLLEAGGLVLVSSPGSTGKQGAIYAYNPKTWELVRTFMAPGSTPTTSDGFGQSMAVLGDRLAVGAESASTHEGVAWVFGLSTGAQQGRFPGPSKYSSFAASVALWGANLVVGAPRDTAAAETSGAVYLYPLPALVP